MPEGRLLRGSRAWLLAACLLAAPGCVNLSLLDGRTKPLVETVVHGKSGPKVLLLEIDGLIAETPESDAFFGRPEPSMVSRVREQLDKAREDDEIRALLLRVNSPGGTVTASDIVYRELLRFKKDTGVPVIAHLLGLAASGGYYVSMAADRVLAHPTTVTGSIGVIFVGLNFSGLMDKLGIEDQTLTTGDYKDAGSPFRPMTPKERAQLQSVLDDMHARFEEVVVQGRQDLDPEGVAALADGRIFSARQALEMKLVDGLGDLEDAVAETERMAGLDSSRVVRYHRPDRWVKNLYARPMVPAEITVRIDSPLRLLERPGFLYLWAPGAWPPR
jgi:protease-4